MREISEFLMELHAAGELPTDFAPVQHLEGFPDGEGERTQIQEPNAALMAARFDFSNQNLRIAQLQANRARLHEVVLALIVLVAARIAAGVWLTVAPMLGHPAPFDGGWLQGGGWLGIAGLLLGYHRAYAWGLRARLPARTHA